MLDHVDPAAIADPAPRTLVLELLNLVNTQAAQLQAQAAEIGRLRDEADAEFKGVVVGAQVPATAAAQQRGGARGAGAGCASAM
ncbi:MAG TPA: hypothetical protein VKY74_20425 [Chloroflexia bacterium]|nr:hypothetical protein [Chloroflexia bacterium]